MDNPVARPLLIGVMGLGPNWQERYKPALLAHQRQFTIGVLCDQVQQRATMEAHRLGCEAAEGPSDLLATPDLDAVLLLDRQWYRLWPLELACRAGKPILCVPSLEIETERAEQLCSQIRQAQRLVMFEARPRYFVGTVRLQRLLQARLGSPYLMLCRAAGCGLSDPGRSSKSQVRGLKPVRPLELIDWCLHLMQGSPERVLAMATQLDEADEFETWSLEFPGGRVVQINYLQRSQRRQRTSLQAELITERGQAVLAAPDRIRWSDRSKECLEHFSRRYFPERRILRTFYRLVTGQACDYPGIEQVYQALRIVQAAAQSRAEGRPVKLETGSSRD